MNIKPENRFWIGIYGFAAFILLVAVCVFGWLAWSSKSEPGVGHVAGAVPVSPVIASLSDEEYQLLAKFDAPPYLKEPGAPRGFDDAMAPYRKQDYAAAAAALQSIGQASPDFVPAKFYLGVSQLLAGDRIAGIQKLREIVEANSGPYLERARFYLAKGLLAEHDLPRAEQQLKDVVAQHGDLEKPAAALLDQIHSS